MMGYGYEAGFMGGMAFWGTILYVLVAVALALSIVALWKHINKK